MVNEIDLNLVWKSEESKESSIDFWNRTLTTINFDVTERSEEVVFQVVKEDAIIGISTAKAVNLPHFGNVNFYNFRMLIHPEHRIPGLADKLTVDTISFLENLYLKNESDCIGVLAVLENNELNNKRREAVFSSSGLTFVGNSKNGAQIRIKYFKGAKI